MLWGASRPSRYGGKLPFRVYEQLAAFGPLRTVRGGGKVRGERTLAQIKKRRVAGSSFQQHGKLRIT